MASGRALKDQYPLRVLIGTEDVTFLLANGFTFSSVDPGGFEMASLVVPKDLPQTLRGMPIRIDCGLNVAWEGRVSEMQRSLGNETTITGEGNGALLKDNDAAMIFVDRDLTYWEGPSVTQQINAVGIGLSPSSGQVSEDPTSGNPSIALSATGAWAAGGIAWVQALYDAQGIDIESIYFNVNYSTNAAGVGFAGQVALGTTDTLAAFDATTSPVASGPGTLTASVSNRVFAALIAAAGGAGGVANALYTVYFDDLAVYGNHGLAQQGSAPAGFYPSQIATWAMQQASGLQAGVIPITDATGYIVPHSVYYTPVGLDQIVDDMATAAGWHWGVWQSQAPLTGNAKSRLDFRPRPPQGTYTASCLRSDCDTCDIREDLSGMYDTAIINYTNVDGTSRFVSVFSPNPVLQAVNLHRTVVLSGGTMTAATATVFGAMALDLLYTQARVAGSITITTAINSMAGQTPAWMLQPGIDRLRINDLPSSDAFGTYNDIPLSRMECSGNEQGFSTNLEVGQGGNLVETLQSRLNSAATLAAQGGS